HKVKRRDVALRASGHGVIIKKIRMPLMNPAELAEQIPWEAENHIPFDLSDVHIDYEVLRKMEEQGQMDVLLVAAKKVELADLLNIAAQARLRPKVVDLDAFAVQNVFEAAYGSPPQGETIALVHAGASLTTLNILNEGTTAFTRDIVNGGDTVTAEIRRQLNLSQEQAEQVKCGEIPGPQRAVEILNQVVDQLAGELQRS